MRIIFVSYGAFSSNSCGHVANFANRLKCAGHMVAVCASGDPEGVRDFVEPLFHCFPHEIVDFAPERILACGDDDVGMDETIIHAWTPREHVRLLTEALMSQGVGAYFVHLEDNEDVLAATNLGMSVEEFRKQPLRALPMPYPRSLSHPLHARWFLEGAKGVTAIVDTLREFAPPALPFHVLEPGVDSEKFAGELEPARAAALRAELGIEPDEAVCVYHGNMHPANEREIFSLYTAMLLLARRRRRVKLIRTGKDFTDGLDVSYSSLKTDNVIELGFVGHGYLQELLKLADFFVQPGASNAFNDYRFPSKLPEFLARGRPVVMPATNVGLRMRDGVDALLLHRGDGREIADCVERILENAEFARTLGSNAQRFAFTELNWERNSQQLLEFYDYALWTDKDHKTIRTSI